MTLPDSSSLRPLIPGIMIPSGPPAIPSDHAPTLPTFLLLPDAAAAAPENPPRTDAVSYGNEIADKWGGIAYHVSGDVMFLAWSISFYPQLLLNWRRKSVEGMSVAFLWYNLLGFGLYSIYTVYQPESSGQDIAFGVHAFFITVITLLQVWIYRAPGDPEVDGDVRRGTTERRSEDGGLLEQGAAAAARPRGRKRRTCVSAFCFYPQIHKYALSLLIIGLTITLFLTVLATLIADSNKNASDEDSDPFLSWTDFLYICGFTKTIISVLKYTPQVYLNYRRKSTKGFSMGNAYLDMVGGFTNILQQFVMCYWDKDTGAMRPKVVWDPFTQNLPKFLIGLASLVYDSIYLWQHFVLYGDGGLTSSLAAGQGEEGTRASGTRRTSSATVGDHRVLSAVSVRRSGGSIMPGVDEELLEQARAGGSFVMGGGGLSGGEEGDGGGGMAGGGGGRRKTCEEKKSRHDSWRGDSRCHTTGPPRRNEGAGDLLSKHGTSCGG